jgi:hypothetical protein
MIILPNSSRKSSGSQIIRITMEISQYAQLYRIGAIAAIDPAPIVRTGITGDRPRVAKRRIHSTNHRQLRNNTAQARSLYEAAIKPRPHLQCRSKPV